MKTKKEFDAVKYMRQERDRINKEIACMTHEQVKDYFVQKRSGARMPD